MKTSVCALAAGIFATALSASPSVPDMEEVVVSAYRPSPLSLGNAMVSAHVVTQEEIRVRQYRAVYEALRDVPGVDVVATAPGQTASIFVRGEKSEQTLVLVDGVEFNDPTDAGRGVDLGAIRLDNVERIEVIRGAQSVRYPGVGAVIQIVTRSGRAGKPVTELGAEGGSQATFRTDISTRGLTDSGLDYSVGGGFFRTDGVSSAAGGRERDGSRTATVSGKIGKRFSDRTRVDLVTRYSDAKTDLDDVPRDVRDFHASQRNLLARLQGSTKAGVWEPSLSAGIRTIHRDSLNQGSVPQNRFVSRGAIYKLEWTNRFCLDEAHFVTGAVETERQQADITSDFGFGVSAIDRKVEQSAVLLELSRESESGLHGTAGARVDHHSAFGWQPMFRAAPAFRFAATGTVLRVAAGTGFKAPSIYQLYGEFGGAGLRPERSLSLDIGVEQPLFGDRAVIVATAFRNRLTDMVDFDFTGKRYFNVGKAVTEGVELVQSTRLGDKVRWSTAYTFLKAFDESKGERLLRRPRHRFSNTLLYAHGSWEAALTHQLVGSRIDVDAATFRRKELPAYHVINLAGSYRLLPGTTLTARLENALDSRYQVIDGYNTPGLSVYAGIRQEL